MVATTAATTAPHATGTAARVERVGFANGLTTVLLDDGRPLVLATRPDARTAAVTRQCFDRVLSLHLTMHGDHAACELRGIRHRQPASMAVSLGVGLAFASAGLATSVCTDRMGA